MPRGIRRARVVCTHARSGETAISTPDQPPTWQDRERASCRRPIQPREVHGLELLGANVRSLRESARLSRPQLSMRSGVSVRTIARIETGIRRTRVDTLTRLITGIFPDGAGAVCARVVGDASGVLAPQSEFAARVARRRARRERKTRNRAVAAEAERTRTWLWAAGKYLDWLAWTEGQQPHPPQQALPLPVLQLLLSVPPS